jgi:hypothetical protein
MQAGASARERLKEAAARAWGVERSQVEAKLGTLKAGNRTGTYAEFATGASKITLAEEPATKKPKVVTQMLGIHKWLTRRVSPLFFQRREPLAYRPLPIGANELSIRVSLRQFRP